VGKKKPHRDRESIKKSPVMLSLATRPQVVS